MTELSLSEAEKNYIINGVKQDIRIDGRNCLNYRNIDIEVNVISNAFGSAHIRLGNCDVMAAIKVELVQPELDLNQQDLKDIRGRIEFFADLSANASPFFEGKGGQEIANLIVSTLTSAYEQSFDFKSLSVLENKYVWIINVDILILEVGSKASLFDACAIAAKAALLNTSIPRVFIDELNEVKISEDVFDITKLKAEQIPLFITLTRIGLRFIVDSTQEEEAASLASILFAVDSAGEILHSRKIATGNLHPDALKEILSKVKELGTNLHKEVETKSLQDSFKPNRLSGKVNMDFE